MFFKKASIFLPCVIFFLSVFFLFITKTSAFAVTITITDSPSSISTEPFSVTGSISGATEGNNYLRIDLYKDGTTKYFGETYNGRNWYGGSEGLQYFPVVITKGATVAASFQGRIGSPSSTEFPGSGQYKLRIRRYTNSGKLASGDTQTPVDIQITISTPTPVPTNTPTPTKVPTPTPTTKLTSTPKPTPTKASTPIKTPTTTVKASLTTTPANSPTQILDGQIARESREILPTLVLGESTKSAENNISPTDNKSTSQSKPEKTIKVLGDTQDNLSKILISIGVIFLIACGILVFRTYKKNRKDKEGVLSG